MTFKTASPDVFAPLLAALRRDAGTYFGDSGVRLEPVARLTGPFSDLLRFRVITGSRHWHAFAKVYRPRRPRPYEPEIEPRMAVMAEFELTRALHGAIDGATGLLAPRPIAVFPEQLAIVTEEVKGVPLDRLLKRSRWFGGPDIDLPHVAGRIGAWVRAYQRIAPATGTLSLRDQRDYLDERLQYLAPRILTAADRFRALELFDDLASGVTMPTQPLVATHADLCPSNILVSDDGEVTLLDFAMACSGSRLHDLAHLFMHLDFLGHGPRGRRACVPGMKHALLHGFDPRLSADDPLFQLMLLRHLVCHVTWLSDRDGGLMDLRFRWLARRRWHVGLAGLLPGAASAARPGRGVPVQPGKLPVH